MQRAARACSSEGATAVEAGSKDHAGFLLIFFGTLTTLDPAPDGTWFLGINVPSVLELRKFLDGSAFAQARPARGAPYEPAQALVDVGDFVSASRHISGIDSAATTARLRRLLLLLLLKPLQLSFEDFELGLDLRDVPLAPMMSTKLTLESLDLSLTQFCGLEAVHGISFRANGDVSSTTFPREWS
jgi:hypothetical protein